MLGTADKTKEVALPIGEDLLTAFHKSKQLRWPPIARHLESLEDIIPLGLEKFLTFLTTGKHTDHASDSHSSCSIYRSGSL